jgi:hypothetical protein
MSIFVPKRRRACATIRCDLDHPLSSKCSYRHRNSRGKRPWRGTVVAWTWGCRASFPSGARIRFGESRRACRSPRLAAAKRLARTARIDAVRIHDVLRGQHRGEQTSPRRMVLGCTSSNLRTSPDFRMEFQTGARSLRPIRRTITFHRRSGHVFTSGGTRRSPSRPRTARPDQPNLQLNQFRCVSGPGRHKVTNS